VKFLRRICWEEETGVVHRDNFDKEMGDDGTRWVSGANHQISLGAKARSAGSEVGETWRGVLCERDGQPVGHDR